MSVILEAWNSLVSAEWDKALQHITLPGVDPVKAKEDQGYIQSGVWSPEDIRRSRWARSTFDISSESKMKYYESYKQESHHQNMYPPDDVMLNISIEPVKVVVSRIENSDGYLGMRSYVYGRLASEVALVVRDISIQREHVMTKLNPAERELVSAAWSAKLREKVLASEALSKSREVSIVMEYDVEDEPWRTW